MFTAPALDGPWTPIGTTLRPERNEVTVTVGPGSSPRYFAIGGVLDVLWVNFGYEGTEVGTREFPMGTLDNALHEVVDGGAIYFDGASAVRSSSEVLVISEPLTLRAVEGAVAIGSVP